jgi:tRNA A37 threonylcarbamoyladenosine dehydratase
MGAALRSDPTQIQIADIGKTKNCPLARRLRQRLRRAEIEEGITCVFSTEPVTYHYQEPDEQPPGQDNSEVNRGRQRRALGSLPTLTGIFGLIIANSAILRLTNYEL